MFYISQAPLIDAVPIHEWNVVPTTTQLLANHIQTLHELPAQVVYAPAVASAIHRSMTK